MGKHQTVKELGRHINVSYFLAKDMIDKGKSACYGAPLAKQSAILWLKFRLSRAQPRGLNKIKPDSKYNCRQSLAHK